MKHLPRPVADLIRIWHDLVLHPREVLLNRCHHQWRGAGFIALIAVLVVMGAPGFPAGVLLPALLLAGPSWVLDLVGTLAHGLWQSGRIWQGVECQCCGGDPDDGDDEAEPDDPADDGASPAKLRRGSVSRPPPTTES
ncbi:hypothetical protein OOK39_02155 [Streptomyces sp. NBC_00264]|uniref:hypothetical protein n=1 Tax=unclassified Streptomyces TaxID=2593676 RepID=UPI002258D422|nr:MULTISPECIES: hypothetical protein [unclassified Streptomyces]MCX5158103.1 hypothetical protein [Streptomyces sp. NBC_00305]MCX5216626.1 hypothetical protein [Streptomyces sp. NBC_00264]